MPILLSEPKKIYYYSSYFSFASLACAFILILTIIMSYLVIYLSGRVFPETITEIVQPSVTFNDQFVVSILEGDDYKTYSSIIKYNDFYTRLLEVPLIKIQKLDNNNDSVIDKIIINLKFPCRALEIKNVKLSYFFDYELHYNNDYFSFPSINNIDVDTPLGVSRLNTYGSIDFKQKWHVNTASYSAVSTSGTLDIINNSTYPLDLNQVKYDYLSRNYTTIYNYYSNVLPFVSSQELEINVEIDIPVFQEVLFKAPYLYAFKTAWVQYLSVLIPCALFSYFLMYFVFKMGVLETIIIKDK